MTARIATVTCLVMILGLVQSESVDALNIEDLKKGVVKIDAQVEGQSPKAGTGFVVLLTKQRAYIVTASHVIKGDPHPQVTFFPQPASALTAQVLGEESDEETGLAVLLVEGNIPSGTRMLDLDTSAKVGGGEAITVIGFPRFLDTPWAVTKGTVTGLKQDAVIMLQLPVVEGNSGSPVLVNQTVVGVVVQRQMEFGLAISTKKAQSVVDSWVPKEKEKEIISGDGAPMVLIPAGKFLMGSDDGDYKDEQPQRSVYLDAFYIDQYEVTNSLYMKLLQDTGHRHPQHFKAGYFRKYQFSIDLDGNRPVVLVSWQDAQTYCRWAGKRLPTEAQWEKTARGPKGQKYPWGNNLLPSGKVNWGRAYSDNWLREGLEAVGHFKADQSVYGVFDMGGNVSEWVADGYSPSAYKDHPDRNPIEPMNDFAGPAFRGSPWSGDEKSLHSAKRYYQFRISSNTATDQAFVFIGFRCARDAKQQ